MPSIQLRTVVVALFALCAAQFAAAQTAASAPAAGASAPLESTAESKGVVEPKVQRSVVEDDNAKIEELRVRGAVKSITVTSKLAPGLSYEVVPVDAGRNQNPGPTNDRGSTGKSVFRVLSF